MNTHTSGLHISRAKCNLFTEVNQTSMVKIQAFIENLIQILCERTMVAIITGFKGERLLYNGQFEDAKLTICKLLCSLSYLMC